MDDVTIVHESQLVPIESIHPHPANPNEGDVGEVVDSMETLGVFYGSIIVQEDTRTILAGETRWRALRAKGAEFAPVVFVPFDDEDTVRALIGDNEIPRRHASTRQDVLASLLIDLQQQSEHGLHGTGFDEDALNHLIDQSMPNDPSVQRAQRSTTEFRRTCPACGHSWVDGKPDA